jgi:pyruvate/2-oxoglutarate dehydrogenase complex dihydrolipoamide dehydrogenase (E3) component
MIASAYAANMVRRAGDFGVVNNGPVSVDMKLVKSRKDGISGQSRSGVENWLRGMANCTVYQGHGRFESSKEVSVGSERLTADRIFINVGGRAEVPQMPGIEGLPYLTNSSIIDIDFLSHDLMIVGGGYISLEFAQMYRRFGSEVTIIQRASHLVPREDEDISTAIREILEHEGVKVRLNATCIGFSRRGDEIVAHVDCASGDPEVSGSHVLLAVSRRPNTGDLGLTEAGVTVDKRGYIVVDDQLRTSAPGISALGDCHGKGGFTHTAFNDAEIVGANLLDSDPRKVSDRITAYALYVDPPRGRAGLTEEEVRKSGRRALIGRRPMTKVGRAVEKGETQGFMKIMVDAQTHEILGAAILGTGGDEAIHSILDVMYARAPYTVIQRAMHIHPTVSELIPAMLGELQPLSDGAGAPQ